MAAYNKVNTEDIVYFQRVVGEINVYHTDETMEDYSHDEMSIYGVFKPGCVVLPSSTQQVADIVKYCDEHDLSITTRGAGTGLCGGCVPIHGGVVLSTEKMNQVISIDPFTLTAVVQSGVVLMDFNTKVNALGLLYPPDPGEKSATIGGNVATNAGGMRAVKYGVTRDYVKAIEVVLPNGQIITLGGDITKNSSGYDLKDLFIGSEGTLGIITTITLKLVPLPKMMVSLLIPFDSIEKALSAVPYVMQLPTTATTIEFMEHDVLVDAQDYLGKAFPNKDYPAYLLVSYNGDDMDEIKPALDGCMKCVMAHDALDVFLSDTSERQDAIWNARGAFLEAIKNSAGVMDECDVVVKPVDVAEFIRHTRYLMSKHHVRIRVFGHAGDGNLHVYVCKDDIPDEKWRGLVNTVMDSLYEKARELHGMVSGEHGIGHAKKGYLKEALDPVVLQLMKGIKKVFDPKRIMNPGKVVD